MSKFKLLDGALLLVVFNSSSAVAQDAPRDRLSDLLRSSATEFNLDEKLPGTMRFRSFKYTDNSSEKFGTELCVFEALQKAGMVKAKILKAEGDTKSIYQASFSPPVRAAMTGGFFGLDEKKSPVPLGLVKTNGEIVNPLHPWTSGGILLASNQKIQIVRAKSYNAKNQWQEAIQSKPLLVEDSKDGIITANDERFDRSAIALTDKQEVVFAVLHTPGGRAASLAEFSQVLLAYRSAQGGKIHTALAMDGGPGAHLFVPSLSKHCGSGIPNYLPNALVFTQ